jgi:hypothetical protein
MPPVSGVTLIVFSYLRRKLSYPPLSRKLLQIALP